MNLQLTLQSMALFKLVVKIFFSLIILSFISGIIFIVLVSQGVFDHWNDDKGVSFDTTTNIYKLNSFYTNNPCSFKDSIENGCVRVFIFDKHIKDPIRLRKIVFNFLDTSQEELKFRTEHQFVQYWFYRKSDALSLNAFIDESKHNCFSKYDRDFIMDITFRDNKPYP